MPLLTRREEVVVHFVAEGLKNREIGKRLEVKQHSIRNYLNRIFETLGVSTRAEAILYAFNHRDSSNQTTAVGEIPGRNYAQSLISLPKITILQSRERLRLFVHDVNPLQEDVSVF